MALTNCSQSINPTNIHTDKLTFTHMHMPTHTQKNPVISDSLQALSCEISGVTSFIVTPVHGLTWYTHTHLFACLLIHTNTDTHSQVGVAQ